MIYMDVGKSHLEEEMAKKESQAWEKCKNYISFKNMQSNLSLFM